MTTPITPISDLYVAGRLDTPDPTLPRVAVARNLDFSAAAAYEFDFTVTNQNMVFGTVRSMFLDNSSNADEVEVTVSGTDQFFTIPAYAEGYFTITATKTSKIRIFSDGPATDQITCVFYNFEQYPQVWYRFGTDNKDIPNKVYGANAAGVDADAATFNNPILMGGTEAGGTIQRVLVDATGRLVVVGGAVGGNVFGTDAIGVPPTQAPVFIGGIDSIGDIKAIEFNAAGEIPTHDEDVLDAVDALTDEVARADTGTITSVVSAAADTIILAANVNRQGATIFNDSTAILYLALSNVVATNAVYTVQIAAGGYYEVPAKYTGIIKGIWAAANGNARVTELV
jgi:hypothetical protein